jgi:hypothetical protein
MSRRVLLGHRAITQRGEWWAAVLAGGEGTVLSHFAAAALWGIRDRPRAVTDVISPRRIRQQGIRAPQPTRAPPTSRNGAEANHRRGPSPGRHGE